MFRIRIRGIYATALTKFAIDWGYRVVQPTEKIRGRFNLPGDFSPPDVTVRDHISKTGVVAVGKCEAVDDFIEKLRREVDSFVSIASGLHEVFTGVVLEKGLVEGPHGVYRIPPPYVPTPGSTQIFTVVKPTTVSEIGVAIPEIIVEGDYLELDTIGGVKFSKHIPHRDRVRLRIFGEKIGLGVKFKSSARYATEDVLLREVEQLRRELLEISKSGPPKTLLKKGRCVAIILFDKIAKERLDEVRSTVVPTIRGHHALRSQGLGKCLDLLDYLGLDLYENVTSFLAREFVELLHVKPWGDVVSMRGEPVGFRNGTFVIKRLLKPGGILDGIGVRIERGFYALTCVTRDREVVHTYYTPRGEVVGTYININTEPEIGRKIIYIDLLIDVVYKDGVVKILDVEEHEKYKHMYPQRYRNIEIPQKVLLCTESGLKALSQSDAV